MEKKLLSAEIRRREPFFGNILILWSTVTDMDIQQDLRASPVVSHGRVFVHGVTAWLSCLDLNTGELIWKRDLTVIMKFLSIFLARVRTQSCLAIL